MADFTKRTADLRLYDIICTQLLNAGETITGTPTIIADEGALNFPDPVTVNTVSITYPNIIDPNTRQPVIAPVGTVAQVWIGGGAIPTGAQWLDCICRLLYETSDSPTAIEATFVLRLQDNILAHR